LDTRPDRIILLRIPLDIVSPEDLSDIITNLVPNDKDAYEVQEKRNIVLLSLWDLLRARRNSEYRDYLFNAVLVIPISKSLVSGARYKKKKKVYRYMPFKFVISLLSILEKREYPLFLRGGKTHVLKKAEKNIRATFPGLKVVGRCEGRIRKQEELAVIEAIRKSSPSILLAGKGVRGKELWIARNSSRLNSGFRLWCSDLFDVFAEKKHRPKDAVFERGLESIGYCLRSPLKFFRVFLFIYYNLLLLVNKISKR
jgi:N-acetylglucosaminyldiphosphoundecaprenol N-acetyl-beta-D-mannosaminyltransferase